MIDDLDGFGFSGVLTPDRLNGTFEVTFLNVRAHVDFVNELQGNREWKEAFLYMKEQKEEAK